MPLRILSFQGPLLLSSYTVLEEASDILFLLRTDLDSRKERTHHDSVPQAWK